MNCSGDLILRALCVSGFAMLCCEVGVAATHRVPGDFATINGALGASVAGDTVLVAPGTYSDFEVQGSRTACAFLVDGVVLLSEAGSASTTIDMLGMGTAQPNVMYGTDLNSALTVVEGFTIVGAPVGRAGVRLNESETVTFRGCDFRDLDGSSAGGIVARETSIDVFECEFVNCKGGTAGGIHQTDARLYVSGTTFADCERAIGILGNVSAPGEELIVENSTFLRNLASGIGAAILARGYEDGVRVSGCDFEENVADGGGAISLGTGISFSTVENNVFWKNRNLQVGAGGGAIVIAHDGRVSGNTFVENESAHPLSGAAMQFVGPGTVELRNNIVSCSSNGVGVEASLDVTFTGGCNVFWKNTDGNARGYALDPTDREISPLFCDPPIGDFTVAAESPCLPANSGGCGLIGALGEGCGLIAIESMTWGRIKGVYRAVLEGGDR